MEFGFERAPAAVSASTVGARRPREESRRPDLVAALNARKRGAAAVSAQGEHPATALADRVGTAVWTTPVVGAYAGWTLERHPRTVSFRFVGGGIRDLILGERQAAQWIPIRDGKGDAPARGGEVGVRWTDSHAVEGRLTRGRGRRAETVRFVAEHRFRGLAS